MGAKKISAESEKSIVRILRQWPRQTRLTWESLRNVVAKEGESLENVWSRQALSGNENIYAAYLVAKQPSTSKAEVPVATCDSETGRKIIELEAALQELELKYNRLVARHVALTYNVSLLEGGSHLLDPLPDNTKSQQG